VAILLILGVILWGCNVHYKAHDGIIGAGSVPEVSAMRPAGGADSGAARYSWDQENLKRYDVGCPTAVYVAPGGDLEQC
jgi:hypothetical protein